MFCTLLSYISVQFGIRKDLATLHALVAGQAVAYSLTHTEKEHK